MTTHTDIHNSCLPHTHSSGRPKVIAITGGIGSGKSVVARILSVMGYECFDCDSEAKAIMDSSREIMELLVSDIHPRAVENGIINRKVIADTVFSDKAKLRRLNAIVHGAVKDEICRRISITSSYPFFIETAILYESGIDRMVDEVWLVEADIETRISRVMNRNKMSRREVIARIESQDSRSHATEIGSHEANTRLTGFTPHQNVKIIANGDRDALLPQVVSLLPKA